MEKTLFIVAAIALLGSLYMLQQDTNASVNGVPQDIQNEFAQFKAKFNKKYGSVENTYRLQVFQQNLAQIKEFNQWKGEEMMGITQFADLTQQEFVETYLTTLVPQEPTEVLEVSNVEVAGSIDWRSTKVTPIKDQGQCGSCWAFSTTGVLEGWYKTTTGTLPSLSEQQLVDCSGILYGNLGCNGGMPSRALNYVQDKGLTTEAAYPYKAVKGTCSVTSGTYKTKTHASVAATEAGLIGALQTGPVSVAVDATNWSHYVSGIFSDCESALNHAVLAVGYADDHWLVKNSWSTKWGESGYIKLARGNTCGVLNTAVVVTA